MKFSKYPHAWIWWSIFGLSTLILNAIAHNQPAFVERWYSRGLFPMIRSTIDWTTGRLPFPCFYLFWIGVVAIWIMLYHRRLRQTTFWPKLRYWLSRLLGFAGCIIGLFFWLWGFNYARMPLKTQMALNLQPLDSTQLWQDLRMETQVLDSLRIVLVGQGTQALNDQRFWPAPVEDTIRRAVEKFLAHENFPVCGRVRGRFLCPQGLLFKFGASGLYWPFSGEGNVEAGLHPLRKLPTMAHEMSHGFGFCDEGVCNFIAYAACSEHTNPYIAYCARLDYWANLVRACRGLDREYFKNVYLAAIPSGILADEEAIRAQNSKFSELAPSLRYEVYDNYLKSQGITAGMGSYGEVVQLVQAWRRR